MLPQAYHPEQNECLQAVLLFILACIPSYFPTPAYNNIINYFKLIIQNIGYKQKIIRHKKFQARDKRFYKTLLTEMFQSI